MRNGLLNEVRIGIDRDSLTVLRVRGWRAARLEPVAQLPLLNLAPDTIAATLDQAIASARCRGSIASIILADSFARMFNVTPPRNAAGLHDCRAAAALRFKALYDAPLTAWRLEADWDLAHPFLACALPQALLGCLADVARKHRLRVVEIAPHALGAWNRWRHAIKGNAWFGVVHRDTLMLVASAHARIVAVRPITLAGAERRPAGTLAEQIRLEALRLNLPIPATVLLCGDRHALTLTEKSEDIAFRWLGPVEPQAEPAQTPGTRMTAMGAFA